MHDISPAFVKLARPCAIVKESMDKEISLAFDPFKIFEVGCLDSVLGKNGNQAA